MLPSWKLSECDPSEKHLHRLSDEELVASGSTWTRKHLSAFRVDLSRGNLNSEMLNHLETASILLKEDIQGRRLKQAMKGVPSPDILRPSLPGSGPLRSRAPCNTP